MLFEELNLYSSVSLKILLLSKIFSNVFKRFQTTNSKIINIQSRHISEISSCCTDNAILTTSSMRLPIDQIVENVNCKDVI